VGMKSRKTLYYNSEDVLVMTIIVPFIALDVVRTLTFNVAPFDMFVLPFSRIIFPFPDFIYRVTHCIEIFV
jgi:hypothetical protein